VHRDEKHSREYYDIWQIGVLLLDIITHGIIKEINEIQTLTVTDNQEICKL